MAECSEPFDRMGGHRYLAWCGMEFPIVGIVLCGSADCGKAVVTKGNGTLAKVVQTFLHAGNRDCRMGNFCLRFHAHMCHDDRKYVWRARNRDDACGRPVLSVLLCSASVDLMHCVASVCEETVCRITVEAAAGIDSAAFGIGADPFNGSHCRFNL